MRLVNQSFIANSIATEKEGGAVYMQASSLVVANESMIINSSAPGDGGLAGAVFLDGGSVTVASSSKI
eukprot:2670625-Prymnesium_polylepis.1